MKATLLWALAIAAIVLVVVASRLSRVDEPDAAPPRPAAGAGEVAELAAPEVEPRPEAPARAVPDESPAAEPEPLAAAGWRVEGEVKGPDGAPIEGAFVFLELSSRWYSSGAARGPFLTDEGGRYSAELVFVDHPPSVAQGGWRDAVILGRVRAAGHRRAGQSADDLPDPGERTGVVRIDFALEVQAAVCGRVVSPHLTPVALVDVNLRRAGGGWRWEGGEHWLKTDPDGGFSIPIEEAGSFHLAAARCGFGTAMSGPIELELGKDAEVGDLVLVGPGQIEGVVVYPDGQPVQEIEVQAYFDPAIEEVRTPSLVGGLQSDFLRESGGLRFCRARTDRMGRFRLSGLDPGEYVLILGRHSSLSLAGERDPAAPPQRLHATGERDVRLVLDEYRLQVTLRDRQGLLVPQGVVQWRCEDFLRGGATTRYGRTDWYPIEPGLVSLRGVGSPGTEPREQVARKIYVEEGQYETRVELAFGPPPPEPGTLRLSARNPEGEPVGGVFACFEDRTDPIIRHYERERSETGEYVFAVPPGEWELTVYDWLEGGGRAYVPAELDRVVVVSGEESELRITLRSGGYLGLVLHLPSAETELSGLAIIAHPLDGGEPLELRSFRTREGNEWAFIDRIEPEVAYRRESMLARGSYRLEVRADGLGAADVAFAIETGETSDVEVWLTPK